MPKNANVIYATGLIFWSPTFYNFTSLLLTIKSNPVFFGGGIFSSPILAEYLKFLIYME